MIGIWTGCGFSTIGLILPPPDVLGYDACVEPAIQGADATPLGEEEVPIVIII